MFLAASNKAKQLLVMRYCDHVTAAQLKAGFSDLKTLLAELSPGFRVLADCSQLESMGQDCVPEISAGMELIDAHAPARLVRVIPDPSKDIGLNILTGSAPSFSSLVNTIPNSSKSTPLAWRLSLPGMLLSWWLPVPASIVSSNTSFRTDFAAGTACS